MAQLNQMEAYLATLPGGIDAYPEAQHKASTLRVLLEKMPLREHLSLLPPAVAAIVRDPPPVSGWIPEVHANAIYLAGRDLLFSTDEAFLQLIYEGNRALVDGPLYWAMFRLVGANRVIRGAAERWGQFHRGTTLSAGTEGTSALLTLRYPQDLMPALMVRCYATAVRAAVEVAGGKFVRVEIRNATRTSAELVGTWL